MGTVFHDGYHYSTLDFVGPDASCYDELLAMALKTWRKLPRGWEIPTYDQRIVEIVIAKHHWSCDSILLKYTQSRDRLKAFGTLKSARPGEEIYTNPFEIRNGSVKVDRAEKS